MTITKINDTNWTYTTVVPTSKLAIKASPTGLMIGGNRLLWEDIELARKAVPKPKLTPSVIITTELDLKNLEPSMRYELGKFTMLKNATINIVTTARGMDIKYFDSSYTYRKGDEVKIMINSPLRYCETERLTIVDEYGCVLFTDVISTVDRPARQEPKIKEDVTPEVEDPNLPRWLKWVQKLQR